MHAVTPPPQPDGATYLGCYVTSTSAPLLPVWLFVNNWGAVFDYQKCVNIARSMGFKYVGFEYGTKCEAGMDNSRFVNQVGNDTGCVAPCDFNSGRNHQPTYACGGTNRVTLFEGRALPYHNQAGYSSRARACGPDDVWCHQVSIIL